ncbi:cell division control protein 2 homolog [Actinidia eriantha]|uniref:cell division control protein 2 homolog n=1 Tax=Actinidia eriantha TaxID=165200 RepID=UPI002589D06D|nr:cell division control protein 2 homolog [Actinidia eriantha]
MLYRVKRYPLDIIRNFLKQILSGMCYCHSRGLLHRDLKPFNVLVDTSTNTVKIADFGLGRGLFTPSCSLSPEVGSLTYQAPEILLGSPKYSSPVDMWSVGCIFGEMLLLRPLFPGSSKSMVLKEIFRLLGTPTEKTWPGVSILPWFPEVTVEAQPAEFEDVIGDLDAAGADLIRRLLCLNPKERITAEESLKHDYFAV